MNIFSFLAVLWVGIVSACTSHDSSAMMIVEGRTYSKTNSIGFGIRDEAKKWACKQIDCPAHISVDQFKLQGMEVANVHVLVHYAF